MTLCGATNCRPYLLSLMVAIIVPSVQVLASDEADKKLVSLPICSFGNSVCNILVTNETDIVVQTEHVCTCGHGKTCPGTFTEERAIEFLDGEWFATCNRLDTLPVCQPEQASVLSQVDSLDDPVNFLVQCSCPSGYDTNGARWRLDEDKVVVEIHCKDQHEQSNENIPSNEIFLSEEIPQRFSNFEDAINKRSQNINAFYKRGEYFKNMQSFYKRARPNLSGFYKRGGSLSAFYKRAPFYKRASRDHSEPIVKRAMNNFSKFYKRQQNDNSKAFHGRENNQNGEINLDKKESQISSFYKRDFGGQISSFYKKSKDDFDGTKTKFNDNFRTSEKEPELMDDNLVIYKKSFDGNTKSFYKRVSFNNLVPRGQWPNEKGDRSFYKRDGVAGFYKRDFPSGQVSFYKRTNDD